MKVVYLSYTGLMEPLGHSQVLNYLRILAREHSIALVTVEKAHDLADSDAVEATRALCREAGIRWRPLRYHKRPRLLATAWDLAVLFVTAWREAGRIDADFIHARSYIPAFVALALKWLRGTPFIFDMRAFWPEEMITANRLKRGSWLHRALSAAEGLCLRNAAAVVSLTHAAVAHLKAQAPDLERVRFVVIPTCADLARFRPPAAHASGPPVVGCVGTVLSGWFRIDLLAAFFRAALHADPSTRLRVITRDDPGQVRRMMEAAGLAPDKVEVTAKAPHDVPAAMAQLSAAVMFFDVAVSELARCPTRMGEALGCGTPVVGNPGVGDVAEIIRRYGVGIVVEGDSEEAMQAAAAQLFALTREPGLADRCRAAAEDWFSLEKGAATYGRLYAEAV